MVIPRSHDGNTTAGNLREEIRSGVESGLSTLFELEGVDVGGGFLAHSDVVSGEDIFTEVHHRRTFTHSATVANPETVHEVGVTVVHSCSHAAQKSLVDCSESPFCRCVTLSYCAFSRGENVLSETQIPTPRRRAISLLGGHEDAQNVRNFETLPDKDAHVTIQGLNIMTRGKSKTVKLIAGLSLRFEVTLTESKWEHSGQNGEDGDVLPGWVPPALHARVLEGPEAVAPAGSEPLLHKAGHMLVAGWRKVEH
mmetsp:Transcript_91828/g.192015  ORF Transcript_91828/g.192015 Transcript_91828/m.192015 type:complete len:253 (+) Transcript_91828:1822-2580(+)